MIRNENMQVGVLYSLLFIIITTCTSADNSSLLILSESDVKIEEVTTNSAIIIFNTTRNATTYIIDVKSITTSISFGFFSPISQPIKKILTDLQSDTIYEVTVDEINYQKSAAPIYFQTLPKVNQLRITNVYAIDVFTDSITVVWDAIPYVTVYTLKTIPGSIQTVKSIPCNSKLVYNVTNLVAGKCYNVIIQAVAHNSIVTNNELSVCTLTEVGDVTNLVISNVYEDSFDLFWDPLCTRRTVTVKVSSLQDVAYVADRNYVSIVGLDKSETSHNVTLGTKSIAVFLNKEKRPIISNVFIKKASNSSLLIIWTKVQNPLTVYNIEYKQDTNGSLVKSIKTTKAELLLENLQADTLYSIKVTTYINYSIRSSDWILCRTSTIENQKIINIVATDITSSSVTLQWSGTFSRKVPEYRIIVSTNPSMMLTTFRNRVIVSKLKENEQHHVFTIQLVSLALMESMIHKKILGSIRVNMPRNAASRPMIGSFCITSIKDTYVMITWNPLKNIQRYTIVYRSNLHKNVTWIKDDNRLTPFYHKIDGLLPKTLYNFKISGFNGQENIHSREINITTDPNMRKIQLQVINVYTRSIDLYWNKVYGDVIYQINIDPQQQNYILKNQKVLTNKATLWNLTDNSYLITIKVLTINGETSPRIITSDSVKVNITKTCRQTIFGLKAVHTSSTGISLSWTKHENIDTYRVFYYENYKNFNSAKFVDRYFGESEIIHLNNLNKDTLYNVWVETSTILFPIRSKSIEVRTLPTKGCRQITNFKVTNVYINSFDIEWDVYPQAKEYRVVVRCPNHETLYKYFVSNSGSVYINYPIRKYNATVEVWRKIGEDKNYNITESEKLSIVLPNRGTNQLRPSIYLWIEYSNISSISLKWNSIGKQAIYKLYSNCQNPYISISNVDYIGGFNIFHKKLINSEYPLTYGTKCIFYISVASINAKSYKFDWKSNKAVAKILPMIRCNTYNLNKASRIYIKKNVAIVGISTNWLTCILLCLLLIL